jgi:hypothetical protein
MNRKVHLGLSLAAGLLGGVLSHYVAPEMVHAAQVAPVPPPKEMRAQSFVLVNSDGSPAGLFGFDRAGRPNIELFDRTGKVVWSTDIRAANSKPLAVNEEK